MHAEQGRFASKPHPWEMDAASEGFVTPTRRFQPLHFRIMKIKNLLVRILQTTSALSALSVLADPVITTQPQEQIVLVGEAAAFDVQATGSGPLKYQWWHGQTALTGKTSRALLISRVQPDQAGPYSVVVTDDTGSVTSWAVPLQIEIPAPLVTLAHRWKFNESGIDLDPNWNSFEFDDRSWREGEAPFYNESATLPIPKNTPLALTNAAGHLINTHYFRTRFNFSGNLATTAFLFATNYIDDGAAFYLNGVQLGRLRLPAGPLISSTLATVAPEGRASLMLSFAEGVLRPGENVLAVEVHQQGSQPADVVFGMVLVATTTRPQMPDLVVWRPVIQPRLEQWSFEPSSCEVREGLVQSGARTLLRFATETRNIGTADLVMTAPASTPEFVFHPCHGHYHFDGYMRYRLRRAEDGQVVIQGSKASFALEDTERWDPRASATVRFSSSNPGIQRGWADRYTHVIPGQWLDVTEVPPGNYLLELELDPDHKLAELDESNNVAVVPVEIPADFAPCTAPPANDGFANAMIIPQGATTVFSRTSCATRERGEPLMVADGPARPGGPSVWFRWRAPESGKVNINTDGSNFDTVLAVYRGTNVTRLTRLASDDESGSGSSSRVTASVVAGSEYFISVEGYYSFLANRADAGDVVLNIISNDQIAAARPITGTSGTVLGNVRGATLEDGELGPGEHSVWFSWVAPSTGTFAFYSSDNTDFWDRASPVSISVSTKGLEKIPLEGRPVTFWELDAGAGELYTIRLIDRVPEAGPFRLSWHLLPHLRMRPGVESADWEIEVLAPAGSQTIVESSADLTEWTQAAGLSETRIILPIPKQGDFRFFRARLKGGSPLER